MKSVTCEEIWADETVGTGRSSALRAAFDPGVGLGDSPLRQGELLTVAIGGGGREFLFYAELTPLGVIKGRLVCEVTQVRAAPDQGQPEEGAWRLLWSPRRKGP